MDDADVGGVQTSASWLGVAGSRGGQCGASGPKGAACDRADIAGPAPISEPLMPPPRPLAAAAAPSRAGRTIGGGTHEASVD